MYIWRGKNRRDRRSNALAGSSLWGVPSGSHNHEAEDELLRYEGERNHIEYFAQKTKFLMEKYLGTPHGREEVDLLLDDISRLHERLSGFVKLSELNKEKKITIKKNVRVLFGNFSISGSNLITVDGLKAMLSDLEMTMNKEEFDEYRGRLIWEDTTDGLLLDFEDFYTGLCVCSRII